MPEGAIATDGGLSAPARKRGRPRLEDKPTGNGVEEQPGRIAESVNGTEKPDSAESKFKVIDPFTVPEPGDDTGSGDRPRKRRGRKSKSEAKEETVQNLNSLLKIEKILVSSAFFLGNILSAPEFHMSEEQSADIGEALREIARLYPVGVSEKTIAWINLSFAVGGWAAPAMVAIAKRPRPQAVNRVVNIRPENPVAPGQPIPQQQATTEKPVVPSQLWNEGDDGTADTD